MTGPHRDWACARPSSKGRNVEAQAIYRREIADEYQMQRADRPRRACSNRRSGLTAAGVSPRLTLNGGLGGDHESNRGSYRVRRNGRAHRIAGCAPMNTLAGIPKTANPIDLSLVPDFSLGPVRVQPSLRRVDSGERQEVIEPRVMQVLIALARADGRVLSRDALIEACWAGRIVGDDTINRCIGKIRQLSELAPGAFQVETIPRIGYRLAVAGNASNSATVPAGVSPAPPATGWTRRGMVLAGAGAAVAATAAGLGLWTLSRTNHPVPAGNVRIAVMPFTALGGGVSQDYFAHGLAEEVMTSLGRIPRMRVAARTSSFMLTSAASLSTIAQTLGATHVLYGTVEPREGGQRIAVRLVDVRTGGAIWSDEYNLSTLEIAGVEDHIAGDAAQAVAIYAAPIGTYDRGKPSPQALDFYFRGRDAFFQRGPENVARAISFLEAAVQASPNFGKALAALGAAYGQYLFQVPAGSQDAMIAKALDVSDRALKIDPRLGDAYAVKAQMLPPFGNWSEIDDLLLRGLDKEPENVALLSTRSLFLMSAGRNQAALDDARTLFTSDPLCPFMTSSFVRALTNAGQVQEAADRFSYADRLWPNHFLFWELRAFYGLETSNDFQHGQNTTLAVPPEISATQDVSLFTQVEQARRDPARIPAVSQALIASAATGQDAAHRAIRLLCDIGKPDAALPITRRLLAQKGYAGSPAARFYAQWPHREVWPVNVFAPSAAALRSQTGFGQIVRDIGLTAYWMRRSSPDGCDAVPSSWCMSGQPT
jgi:TolB-like protein/DNA-binding winged helix-turn-helix (wHTH) protein